MSQAAERVSVRREGRELGTEEDKVSFLLFILIFGLELREALHAKVEFTFNYLTKLKKPTLRKRTTHFFYFVIPRFEKFQVSKKKKISRKRYKNYSQIIF